MHGSRDFSTARAASLPGFQECVLNNHHYGIGEMFHPIIDVNGTKYEAVCFNCTCTEVRNFAPDQSTRMRIISNTRYAPLAFTNDLLKRIRRIFGVNWPIKEALVRAAAAQQ